MYLLPALAAGLVRCFHIDCLDKLSEGIRGQLREGAVPLYPLNKLLYIGGIVGAWLDLGIRVRIGEMKRADFTVLLAVIKIIIGKNLVQFLVGQFDDLIVFSFGFTSSSLLFIRKHIYMEFAIIAVPRRSAIL